MMVFKRTHMCGELRLADAEKEVDAEWLDSEEKKSRRTHFLRSERQEGHRADSV